MIKHYLKQLVSNKLVFATIICVVMFLVVAPFSYLADWAVLIALSFLMVGSVLLGIIRVKVARQQKQNFIVMRQSKQYSLAILRLARARLWTYRVQFVVCFLFALMIFSYVLTGLNAIVNG